MQDYAKIQELQDLLTFSDSQKILNYAMERQWISIDGNSKTQINHDIIFYIHRIIDDLVYGYKTKVFHEFQYEYLRTTEKRAVEILRNLVRDFQVLCVNRTSVVVHPLKEGSSAKKDTIVFKEDEQTKALKKTLDGKTDKMIQTYVKKLAQFHAGKISKTDLLEGLDLKGKLYRTADGTAVLHVSQLYAQSQTEMQTVAEDQIQTIDFILPSLFDYFQLLGSKDEAVNEKEYAAKVQFSCEEELRELIKEHLDGAVDYTVRIAFLAYYRHSEIYSPDLFKDMLKITDERTLRFRQENGVQHVDFVKISDEWFNMKTEQKKILEVYTEEEKEKDDDEEDMEKSREFDD